MVRKSLAAGLIASALVAAPVFAQQPAGPTPPTPQAVPGAPAQNPDSSQGKVVGTPKDPGSTADTRSASLVPVFYVGLIAVLAFLAYFFVRRRRNGRG